MKSRTGIYPGTFDPIHPGHIAFAVQAMQACKLDEVVFLPEQKPRDKSAVTDISHRTALVERAVTPVAGLRVMSLQSKQFTVGDTLPEIRKALGDSHLTLLVGSDVVRTFLYRWEGLGTLLSTLSLAIGMRSDDDTAEMVTIMEQLERDYALSIDYTITTTAEAGKTSSQIRNGTADLSLLHPDTLGYMREHRLYSQA